MSPPPSLDSRFQRSGGYLSPVSEWLRGQWDVFVGLRPGKEALYEFPSRLRSQIVYRHFVERRIERAREIAIPPHPLNAALRAPEEIDRAKATLDALRLEARYNHPYKVWDGYRFFSFLVDHVDPESCVLDQGSGPHSNVLDWLQLYGYRNLWATDVVFTKPRRHGLVRCVGDDLRQTRFEDASFQAIMAQSSIEHGVEPADFFREAGRLCSRGGYLLVSTDFWPIKIDTTGLRNYGVPWTIFSRDEILAFTEEGARHGFELTEPVDFAVDGPLVDSLHRRYTFLFLAMRKG